MPVLCPPAPRSVLQIADAPPIALHRTGWPAVVSELDRRGFLLGGAVAAAAALTGCATTSGPAAPAMIDFSYQGVETRIPAEPTRVAVVEGRGDLEFALVAGYPVVASGFYFGRDGALLDELSEFDLDAIQEIRFTTQQPDPEQLAALEPDLIVMRANAFQQDFYGNDLLTRIAPILAVQAGRPQWVEDVTGQAAGLQREDRGQSEIERYEALVAEAREALGDIPDRLTLTMGTALDTGGMYVWANLLANRVAADLGFTQPHYDPSAAEPYFEVGGEELGTAANADVLFVQSLDDRPALQESPLFRARPAAVANRVFDLDATLNNGLGRAACGVVRRIRTALTGDTAATGG
ncbi:hypothetical protein GCM10009613_49690 [Pseudonocardia kongjuensis]|uniref:Fe/B12 periplasmic-binding domain-containing protein n=1 Tax=Pseudonocardia kongjuensis TaxID=102227 RepID=A0ABN1Y3Y1_9PSEU